MRWRLRPAWLRLAGVSAVATYDWPPLVVDALARAGGTVTCDKIVIGYVRADMIGVGTIDLSLFRRAEIAFVGYDPETDRQVVVSRLDDGSYVTDCVRLP